MDTFSIDEFKQLLRDQGFTQEDIDQNWQKYLESAMSATIEDCLKQMPIADRNSIIGQDNIDTPEGLKNILTRFMTYFNTHISEFKPALNLLNFKYKIKPS